MKSRQQSEASSEVSMGRGQKKANELTYACEGRPFSERNSLGLPNSAGSMGAKLDTDLSARGHNWSLLGGSPRLALLSPVFSIILVLLAFPSIVSYAESNEQLPSIGSLDDKMWTNLWAKGSEWKHAFDDTYIYYRALNERALSEGPSEDPKPKVLYWKTQAREDHEKEEQMSFYIIEALKEGAGSGVLPNQAGPSRKPQNPEELLKLLTKPLRQNMIIPGVTANVPLGIEDKLPFKLRGKNGQDQERLKKGLVMIGVEAHKRGKLENDLFAFISLKPLTHAEQKGLLRDVLKALTFLNKHQICHNDGKLENIIVYEGRFFLIDVNVSFRFDDGTQIPGVTATEPYSVPYDKAKAKGESWKTQYVRTKDLYLLGLTWLEASFPLGQFNDNYVKTFSESLIQKIKEQDSSFALYDTFFLVFSGIGVRHHGVNPLWDDKVGQVVSLMMNPDAEKRIDIPRANEYIGLLYPQSDDSEAPQEQKEKLRKVASLHLKEKLKEDVPALFYVPSFSDIENRLGEMKGLDSWYSIKNVKRRVHDLNKSAKAYINYVGQGLPEKSILSRLFHFLLMYPMFLPTPSKADWDSLVSGAKRRMAETIAKVKENTGGRYPAQINDDDVKAAFLAVII